MGRGNILLINIIFIILGFIFLIKGADLLVKAATSIAKKLGLSEVLIGLTILAIGTSLPEIFITISSAINGHFDLIISNAIGSSICNLLLVVGIASLFNSVKINREVLKTHFVIEILISFLLLFLFNSEKNEEYYIISRGQGLILIFFAILYILYSIYEEKKLRIEKIEKNLEKPKENIISFKKIIIYMILGILGLKYGSDFVVNNSIKIANYFKVSEEFIGLTIVAIGTALPEIITSIISVRKNRSRFDYWKYYRFKYF